METFETDRASTYQLEDVQQILQIAIARQVDREELSREQLLEIAEELSISADCLQAAEREWRDRQSTQQQQQAFNAYRRQRFYHKLGKSLILGGFFVAVDILSGGTLSWSRYLLLGCGLWVSLKAWNTFGLSGEAYDKAFRSWERQRQLTRSVGLLWNKVQRSLQG